MVSGNQSTALGVSNTVTGYSASAVGNNNRIAQDNSFVVGNGVTTSQANSVVLGNASTDREATTEDGITLNGTNYTFAGPASAANGVASVGSVGQERQIINVAAGRVASDSTDAINGSQLNATNQAIDSLGVADAGNVKYGANADGTVDYSSVTLNGPVSIDGGATGGTTITNVHQGEVSSTSTDAVNGAQLFDTNQNVSSVSNLVNNFAGDQTDTYIANNGAGIKYARTNETGLAAADAHATVAGATALGYNATASHQQSVAIGRDSLADGSELGNAAYNAGAGVLAGTNAVGEVSIGNAGSERRLTNLAAGANDTDAVNVSQLKTLASSVTAADAGSVKYGANADGTVDYSSVTLGGPVSIDGGATGGTTITNVHQGEVSFTSTDAVNGAQLFETNQNVTNVSNLVNNFAGDQTDTYIANSGAGIKYARTNETGLAAADAHATVAGATALGYNATASHDQSVAIGRDSLADGSKLGNAAYNAGVGILAGTSAVGEVSIGKAGSERRLTNLAAGADDTDAVNVSQLKSLASNMTAAGAGGVKYDQNPDGTINQNNITLSGNTYNSVTKTGGTKITNVARGVDDSDAVNMSQLNETNQNVANLDNRVTNLGDQITTINNGAGIKYFHANSTQPDSQASGTDSVAIGANATSSGTNSMAAGSGAQASGAGAVALGNGAVATASGSVALGQGASDGGRGAESYTGKYSTAQNDTVGTISVGNAATGETRTISNVADGKDATDAVNLRQLDGAVAESKSYTDRKVQGLNDTVSNVGHSVTNIENRVTKVGEDVTKIQNGTDGMFQVNDSSQHGKPKASGKDSIAGGAGAVASADNSSAIGANASAKANNSVALGANSVADRANTVSVGSSGAERQITNLAAGTQDTDAVNLSQLKSVTQSANAYTDTQINGLRHDMGRMEDDLSAGIAGAMAASTLPQPYSPGASMASVGTGYYNGQNAVAVGVSRISDNGHWVSKIAGSADSRGNTGLSVGVGYQW